MRITLYAISAIAMLFGVGGCTTESGRESSSGAVTIQFVNPGQFTDFRVQSRDVRESVSIFTQEVTRSLEPVMQNRFPGDLLTLRFTDIDLSGRRRSSAGASSVRVVRSLGPARLSFAYVLQDKSGRVLASGSERLIETRSTRTNSPGRSRPLSIETQMLQRWLHFLPVPR